MQEKIMMQVTLCMYNTFEDKAVWVDLLDFWGGKPANTPMWLLPLPLFLVSRGDGVLLSIV